MARLSPNQIAAVVRKAGFPESQVAMAVAIAYAESGGDPAAVNNRNRNGSSDYGLFQINSVHKAKLAKHNWRDPQENAKMAYLIWEEAGSKWRPWATYNSGSYKKHYKPNQITTSPGSADAGTAPPTDATALGGTGGAETGIGLGPITPLNLFGFASTKAFWMRFGIGVIGTGLIIIGVIIIFRKPIAKGATTVLSFTPVGKGATLAGVAKSAVATKATSTMTGAGNAS